MCGIVGIYSKKENVSGHIYDGLIQVQHRGQDAAGNSTWDGSKMYIHKDLGLVTEAF
jgi:Glutamine phosphoribosylpyrophosphate amidotransferase